jgi:hypothetical protein
VGEGGIGHLIVVIGQARRKNCVHNFQDLLFTVRLPTTVKEARTMKDAFLAAAVRVLMLGAVALITEIVVTLF